MPRKPKPGEWQYTVEDLTAYERADRGNAIYTRVWDGKSYVRKQALCAPIRNAQGKIDPALETAAQQLAIARQAAIAAGLEPDDGGPLTLARGLRMLLDERDGKYVGAGAWLDDMERYVNIILEFLDGSVRWQDIEHAHYRKLWRALARENAETGRFGARTAEMIVGALQTASTWLQQEGKIKAGSALPARGWRKMLKDEWAAITATPIAAPRKPRYSLEQRARLWEALPQADQRIRLMTEIGAELRLGQLPRTRRTDLQPFGAFVVGSATVHGRGKKRGEVLILNNRERAVLMEAMTTGYLSELEREYQAGRLSDYFIITGGQLKKGKAQLRHADKPWGKTGMTKKWKKLEELAGVEHLTGMNWYGLRRKHSDLAEDREDDARVLNKLGGWTHTKTREGYQEQGRTDIAERASKVREKLRPDSANLPPTVTPPEKNGESAAGENDATR
jgi:hypothetical protein